MTLGNEKISREQRDKNLELLYEATIRVFENEFETIQKMYDWLYEKGYYVGEINRIRQLHMVEQMDAEYYNKEK